MMATDATAVQTVDAPVVSASQEAADEQNLQNADFDDAHLNDAADEIVDKHIHDIVEGLVNSADSSVGGGSDTEASRHDGFTSKDGKTHTRTLSAVKKPASFKAVSVNKTFLAASKSSGLPGSLKSGDKIVLSTGSAQTAPGASASSAARPRLVAKSGGGLRDFGKATGAGNGGRPAIAPDPSVVWNKNRPPEPKKYSDEELRKFGIHMATRLQPDDARGQANNWADIDDEEEDWAPETISWADGTKITLPQVDDTAPPAPEPSPVPSAQSQTAPSDVKMVEKPRSPAPPTGASPVVKASVLSSGKGLVLKGAPEKPTLVHKPPAPPTPVKSPWATLPPVDKASPIVMDINNPMTARPMHKDGAPPHGGAPPPHAKEMSADDFSRSSWRNGLPSTNRELFNSQSGRYEPVPERRGSTRSDAYPRQPAVLQRPAQGESQGPAEPSAAFQTSRSSGSQDGPYNRRRGSSNVSGGSGILAHRLGKSGPEMALPPLEVLGARRPSVTGVSDDAASPGNYSPIGQHGPPRLHSGQPWQPRTSPGVVHATPHGPPNVDPRAGPSAPAQAATSEADYVEYQKKLMRERREMALKRRLEEEAKEEAERKERIRLKLEAMGPAPERKSSKREVAKDEATAPVHIQQRDASGANAAAVGPQADGLSDIAGQQRQPETKSESQLPNGSASGTVRGDRVPLGGLASRPAAAEPKHPGLWTDSQPQAERYPPWGPGGQAGPRNVWGSPNNDRSLGNGTFISDLGRLGDPTPIQTLPTPGPIGPPAANRNISAHTQGQDAVAARIPPIGPPGGRGPQAISAEQRAASLAAWNRPGGILESDEAIFEENKRRHEEQQRELDARGVALGEVQPLIKDTWKPTNLGDNGGRTSARSVNKVVHEPKGRPAGPAWPPPMASGQPDFPTVNGVGADSRGPAGLGVSGQAPGSTASQPRGSRFFPTRETVPTESPAPDADRTKSPTPPPPTMDDHPAYDGDAARPHVALPPQKPVVRLPPAPIIAPAAASTSRIQPLPTPSGPSRFQPAPNTLGKPHEHVENWQDKINNLIGRKHSPQKMGGMDHPTRSAFDHVARDISRLFAGQVDERSVTTKEMDETCFEEQEMGSLPPVRLPSKAPNALWAPAIVHRSMPRKYHPAISSAEALTFAKDVSGSGVVLRVFLPWMTEAITVTMTHGRGSSSRGRGSHPNRATVRHSSGTGHRGGGGKGRDSSSTFSGEHAPSSTPNTPSSSRNARGGYRGRSDGWARHAPATSQQ